MHIEGVTGWYRRLARATLFGSAMIVAGCGSATIVSPDGGSGGSAGKLGGAGSGGGAGAAGAAGGPGGGAGAAGAAGGRGGAGGAPATDGGIDMRPIACTASTTCPAGTVCGPQSTCVDCSAVTASLPAAPALLRPMRGAYTGSLHAPTARATLRPTFTWSSVTPTCGAITYELEADDSCAPGSLATCAFPSAELDAKGITATSYAPTQDLKVAATAPVGAFYGWRVRGCDTSNRCGAWSEVRYLNVGRVREDINGDGYGDLLVMSNRGIEVYLGSAQFNVTDSSHTIAYTSGYGPSFSGDVNGDGYGDFFGTSTYNPTAGMAPTLYLGGPDVTALSTVVLTKTAGGPSTLMQTTSAGDFNGDGFADLIVQWGYNQTTPATQLRIFYGGTTLANTPDLTIPGPYVNDYTLQHTGRIGDVNGDGYEDIALTAFSDGGSNGGTIQIFAGGAQPTATATVSLSTTSGSYEIQGVGDLNGDGYGDAVVVLSGTGYYLYSGASHHGATFDGTFTDATARDAAGGFDIDVDGLSDFLVGTSAQAPILYRGTATGPAAVASGLSHLGESVIVGFSDNDGDGRPDFLGSSGQGSTSGQPLQWAGSDGTTNPRVSYLQLSDTTAQLSGQIVR
ncbi:MAG TPA: VCBS repeat-containing protein [Polyangia bacterium]|jgi:hypothetical protein